MHYAKQTQRAQELLEQYYQLGPLRTLEKLSVESGVPVEELEDLSELFGWEQLIVERIDELQRTASEAFHGHTLDIRNELVKALHGTLRKLNGPMGLPFAINNVGDLAQASVAFQRLVQANDLAMRTSAAAASNEDATPTWASLLLKADEYEQEHEEDGEEDTV